MTKRNRDSLYRHKLQGVEQWNNLSLCSSDPQQSNVSLVNSVDSSHTTRDQSIFPCPQVGYLQFCVLLPTVPCLWQDPPSEATDPRALPSKMNKTRIKMSRAHFQAETDIAQKPRAALGTPTLYSHTSEKHTYVRPSGQQPDLNVKPHSEDKRQILDIRARLPTPGIGRLVSDSCPAICTLHQIQPCIEVSMHSQYFNISKLDIFLVIK